MRLNLFITAWFGVGAATPGMVGADLANIVNEAALLAVRRGKDTVEIQNLEEAIDRVLLGLEKKRRVMSTEEKARVAYTRPVTQLSGWSSIRLRFTVPRSSARF
jgi:ATP-dependent Zn protease